MMPISAAFTPVHSLLGGFMLASSVHGMLSQLGTVLGISGFLHGAVASLLGSPKSPSPSPPATSDASSLQSLSDRTSTNTSRLFTTGLFAGGLFLGAARPLLEAGLGTKLFDDASSTASIPLTQVLLWGTLVGAGTKLGSGCTSGHFLCGLSRLSPRSIVATATFFSVAVISHLLASEPLSKTDLLGIERSTLIRSPEPFVLVLLQVPALVYGYLMPALASPIRDEPESSLAKRHRFASAVVAFSTGVHFALGLGLTGMLRQSKILGFLSLSPARIASGEWDPSLALVAVGGILPSAAGYFLAVRPKVARVDSLSSDAGVANGDARAKTVKTKDSDRPSLWLASPLWRLPKRQIIDSRLIVGAAIFGAGWGLSGFCPGPVLVNLGAASATGEGVLVLGSYAASMAAAGYLASYI